MDTGRRLTPEITCRSVPRVTPARMNPGKHMDMDDGRTGDGDHRHRLIEDREHARNDALFHAKQHEAKQVCD